MGFSSKITLNTLKTENSYKENPLHGVLVQKYFERRLRTWDFHLFGFGQSAALSEAASRIWPRT